MDGCSCFLDNIGQPKCAQPVPAHSRSGVVVGVVFALLLTAARASAAEPLFAKPGGSGTACSQMTPCSLTKAIELAQAGGSVVLEPGSYSPEAFFVNKAIDIGGAQGTASTTVIEVTTGGFAQVNSPGVVVHDLTFRITGTAGGLNLISGTAERVTVSTFGSTGGGACVIDAQGAAPPLLRDSVCWAHGTQPTQRAGELILSSGLTSSAVLRNDDFIASTSSGTGLRVSATTAGTHLTVEAVNVIAEGAAGDVRATGTAGGQATLTLSHSNFASPTTEGEATVTAATANGNQSGVPLFVDPAGGNFREQATSPTLEKGLTEPANGTLDVAGALRTRSSCTNPTEFTDIGAYQLNSGPVPPCAPPPGSGSGGSSKVLNGGSSGHLTIGKLQRSPRNGTAVLSVTVSGAGTLTLTGKGVKKVTRTIRTAGRQRLRIVPRGRFKNTLSTSGKLKLPVIVSFAPAVGSSTQVRRKLTLLENVR
jgi:hypothetical protein